MVLNPDLLNLIEENELEKEAALIYCFAAEYLGDKGVNYLVEKDLITPDNEHLFRINLLNKDFL